MNNLAVSIATALLLIVSPKTSLLNEKADVVAEHQFSLDNRYHVPSVNEVFKKNILLNLAYLAGQVTKKQDINWDNVLKFTHTEFTLQPGQVFAYHDNLLKQFQGKVSVTTKASFDASDGFVTDGYLYGDGVCHLASIINWVAKDAGLETLAPHNHDFAVIPEVPKQYGVGIYKAPDGGAESNLYITNTKDVPITFHFNVENDELQVYVTESHA